MLSNIGQEFVVRFGISTPVVLAGPHTVIFQNKEESSCPHSYYARLQKKRIFVRKKTTIRQPFSMQLTIRENTEHNQSNHAAKSGIPDRILILVSELFMSS